MKTLWLIGQKVGHFLAVLFLSSLLLAGFLWVSPGSPGKPRERPDWDKVEIGQSVLCVDAKNCGVLLSGPEGQPAMVTLRVQGGERAERAEFLKLPAPGFVGWFLGKFWFGMLKGDVGISSAYEEPALDIVLRRARYTLTIVFATLAAAVTVALALVAFLTWLPFPSLRGVLKTLLLALSIAPVFILGYVLQSAGVLPSGLTPAVLLACIAILSVGDSNLGEMLLHFEDEIRVLRSRDYIHAAGLRGASVFKHMLPGLLLPISSVSAAKVAFLLGSVVIAERLFAVPGLGEAGLEAAREGDALLLLTLTVFITGIVALVALVRDVLEILVDPRMRRGHEDATT
jgi:peptide/nickel transport system permease protein